MAKWEATSAAADRIQEVLRDRHGSLLPEGWEITSEETCRRSLKVQLNSLARARCVEALGHEATKDDALEAQHGRSREGLDAGQLRALDYLVGILNDALEDDDALSVAALRQIATRDGAASVDLFERSLGLILLPEPPRALRYATTVDRDAGRALIAEHFVFGESQGGIAFATSWDLVVDVAPDPGTEFTLGQLCDAIGAEAVLA